MLQEIIDITSRSGTNVHGSTLFCEYEIDNLPFFNRLIQEEIIENILTANPQLGDKIILEFSIFKLKTCGFFCSKSLFVDQYRFESPTSDVYLHDLKQNLEESEFYSNYIAVINLIKTLLKNAKHSYDDAGDKNLIIVREEKSLWLNLNYQSEDLESLHDETNKQIVSFLDILVDDNFPDKKNIYLNELVEFSLKLDEEKRFVLLLENFDNFINNASATYNFYLTNFSYNKLKLEIDAKALEYNQKIQTVINDSQTKLIAIPAAFVLVLSGIDYEKIGSAKNFIAAAGLFIFSALLQLFVNNQKTSLRFISENINYYKSTFKNQARKEVEKAFETVSSEKNKQSERLIYIEIILWFIPLFTVSLLLYLMSFQIAAIVIMFFFLWIASNKIILKY